MKKKILSLVLGLILLLSVQLCACAAYTEGTVWGGWLILRDEPSYAGNILASYPTGTIVSITGSTGSWYAVRTPDGKTGYMYSKWLKVKGEPSDVIPAGTTVYVTSSNGANVRLRTGPAQSYSILAAYAPGTEGTMISYGKNWSLIQIGSFKGYMMTQYLTTRGTPVPTPVPSKEYTVYVTSRNGYGVYLRSGPSKSYSAIGFYSVGTKATMVSEGKTWSYIRIGTRSGYMMTEFLTETEPYNPSPIVGAPTVTSRNGKNVNLRSGPGKNYGVIRSFPVGTTLQIISRGSEWYYISISGYRGYMMKEYIRESGSPEPVYMPELTECRILPYEDLYPGLKLEARVNKEARNLELTYQWLRDGKKIAKATGQYYTVKEEDIGHRISCRVSTTTENGATVQVTSDKSGTVATPTDL